MFVSKYFVCVCNVNILWNRKSKYSLFLVQVYFSTAETIFTSRWQSKYLLSFPIFSHMYSQKTKKSNILYLNVSMITFFIWLHLNAKLSIQLVSFVLLFLIAFFFLLHCSLHFMILKLRNTLNIHSNTLTCFTLWEMCWLVKCRKTNLNSKSFKARGIGV